MVNPYGAWYVTEPDQGYDTQAAEWRGKLPEHASADSSASE